MECPCENPWRRRKVLEVKVIEKSKMKLFVPKQGFGGKREVGKRKGGNTENIVLGGV